MQDGDKDCNKILQIVLINGDKSYIWWLKLMIIWWSDYGEVNSIISINFKTEYR